MRLRVLKVFELLFSVKSINPRIYAERATILRLMGENKLPSENIIGVRARRIK